MAPVLVEEPAADPLRGEKLRTLIALMRRRDQLNHPELAAAFNGLDVVFMDDADVRSAYAAFLAAHQEGGAGVRERMFDLIALVVLNLGLADRIAAEDIERRYEPGRRRTRLMSILEEAERRWGVEADFASRRAA
jgi:hypothetical protein